MSAGHEVLVVITGGPGSGKSTLVEHLSRAGFGVMPEAGRAIIRDQVAIGGPALPWRDPVLFAELMLCWEIRSYRAARMRAGTVFFDHAIPCVAGYLRLLGRTVPAHVDAAATAYRYRRRAVSRGRGWRAPGRRVRPARPVGRRVRRGGPGR